MDAIIYSRVSSKAQNQASCADQVRACRDYADGLGWRVVAEFTDAGISGEKGRADRPGWDALLTLVESGDVEPGVILLFDMDRWSRHQHDGPIMRHTVQGLGWSFATPDKGLLGSDGTDIIVAAITEQLAAMENAKRRRAVKRGLEAKREAGYWSGAAPFGYKLLREGEGRSGRTTLVPRAGQAKVVRRIFEMLDGGETPAAVARILNEEKIATPRKRRWLPDTIRAIARSAVYIGFITRYKTRSSGKQVSRSQVRTEDIELFEGQHDGLVSRAQFDRVQKTLDHPLRGPNSKRKYPLSGIVHCGDCGGRCIVTGGAWPYRNYRCAPYGLSSDCPSKRFVRIELLEAAVKSWASEAAKGSAAVEIAAQKLAEAAQKEAAAQADDRRPIEAEVRDLERQLANVTEAIAQGAPPAALVAKARQIERDLKAAQEKLDALGAAVQALPVQVVTEAILATLEAGAEDLMAVREIVDEIVLPADPTSPPVLRALGAEFELPIPRTAKQRGP